MREPLDPEYRLNRKLAKQIYNKEKNERVAKHKEDMQMHKQHELEAKVKKDKKTEKKKDEAFKAQKKEMKEKWEME